MGKIERTWSRKEVLALFIIPIELILGMLLGKLTFITENPTIGLLFTLAIFVSGFLVMIYLFKDFLKSEWQRYRENKFWWKILLNIVLVIGAFFILIIVRKVPFVNLSVGDVSELSNFTLGMGLLASIQPFIAPFAEELTFRYLLFGKISNKVLKVIMFFVSSILFGLVHLSNFGGNWLLTIPYMVIGAYFALIYVLFDNIWGSIMVHWIFNSLNSIVPALLMVILKVFGVI